MPNLRNDYTCGKTVLDLFKKVFEVKKEYMKKDSDLNQNIQKGELEEAEGEEEAGGVQKL